MSDLSIEKIKQYGKIYFWRYRTLRKKNSGWHTTADKDGCDFITDLIQCMLDSNFGSTYRIQLYEADQKIVSVPNFNEGWISARVFLLKYPKNKVDTTYWELDYSNNQITLTLGEGKLKELQEGFFDVLRGEGDYAIGHESQDSEYDNYQLWFWWKSNG